MTDDLRRRFHDAMIDVYRRAKSEAGYPANRFLTMLSNDEGVSVARRLINSAEPSTGYHALWERGRLDLTVEYLVQEPEWAPLFSDKERSDAADVLRQYGFTGPLPSGL